MLKLVGDRQTDIVTYRAAITANNVFQVNHSSYFKYNWFAVSFIAIFWLNSDQFNNTTGSFLNEILVKQESTVERKSVFKEHHISN